MSKHEKSLPLTMSVPQYGRLVLNIGEASSYAAADRGDFPTIKMGGLRRVPVRVGLRQLAGNDPAVLDAMTKDLCAKLDKATA
jgi:hypothetical protein